MSQAVTEGTAAAHSATTSTDQLDPRSVLKLGLGSFASPVGILWLAVCAMLVWHGVQRLQYALKSEPLVLEASGLGRAGHNDFVRVTGQLEGERQVEFTAPGGERFMLTPLAGTGARLLIYRQDPRGTPAAEVPQTITGRIVSRDWSGHWDLGGRSVDVPRELAQKDIAVPPSALVLIADEIPQFELWPVVIGAAGTLVWMWFGLRVIHTTRLLVNRDRASAELQRLDETDEDELPSLRVRQVSRKIGEHRGA